jgi:phosphate transport system substrate-binding protein
MASSAMAAEELKLSIGVAPMANVFAKIKAPFEQKTGILLTWVQPDPKGAIGDQVFKDVDSGLAEGGAATGTWDDWLKQMREKGYEPHELASLRNRVVGKDIVRFMTYPGGPAELNIEQLVGIVSGKYKNWKQVGGEDRPIVLLISAAQPNTDSFIEGRLLKGEKIHRSDAKIIPATGGAPALVKEIAKTPGAIGYASVNFVDPIVNTPKQPTIGRPITFMWRGQPPKKMLSLFDFIDNQGRKYGLE